MTPDPPPPLKLIHDAALYLALADAVEALTPALLTSKALFYADPSPTNREAYRAIALLLQQARTARRGGVAGFVAFLSEGHPARRAVTGDEFQALLRDAPGVRGAVVDL